MLPVRLVIAASPPISIIVSASAMFMASGTQYLARNSFVTFTLMVVLASMFTDLPAISTPFIITVALPSL